MLALPQRIHSEVLLDDIGGMNSLKQAWVTRSINSCCEQPFTLLKTIVFESTFSITTSTILIYLYYFHRLSYTVDNTLQLILHLRKIRNFSAWPFFRLNCSACSFFYSLLRLQLRSLETSMRQRKAIQAVAKIIQLARLLTLRAGQTWQSKTVTRCSASGRVRSCKYSLKRSTQIIKMLTGERQRGPAGEAAGRNNRVASGANLQPFQSNQLAQRLTAQINSDTVSAEEYPWASTTQGGANAVLFPGTIAQQKCKFTCLYLTLTERLL
jgi:hypothetical protein